MQQLCKKHNLQPCRGKGITKKVLYNKLDKFGFLEFQKSSLSINKSKSPKKKDQQLHIFCYPVKKDKQNEWKIQKSWPSDSFAELMNVCKNTNCNYILKYQKYDTYFDEFLIDEDFVMEEIKNQTFCAEVGLCPKIIDSWVCDDGASFVMEKLDITADVLLKEYKTTKVIFRIFGEIMGLMQRLHFYGLYHGDAHFHNIMVKQMHKPSKKELNSIRKYNDETREYKNYLLNKYKFYFIDLAEAKKSENMSIQEQKKYMKLDYDRIKYGFRYHIELSDEFFEGFFNYT